jgi:2-methylcitrate dehydratase PrpD
MTGTIPFMRARRLLLKRGIGAAVTVATADYARSDEAPMKKSKTAISPVMRTVSTYIAQSIQAPLDSLSALIKEYHVNADDVEKVVVRVSHQGAKTTNDREMPDINMQYMMAVMLLDGTASLEAAHDMKRMQDPKVLALRRRVELYGDDELQRALPVRQGIIELTMRDGRVLRPHTRQVRGTAENPMTRDEVREKCNGLFAPVLGSRRAGEAIEAIWGAERVEDVQSLRPLLRA